MNKYVIIINGKGGSGKDTLIEGLRNLEEKQGRMIKNISSIDKIKEIAACVGWDGCKDQKGRKFLSDLKSVVTGYSDFITEDLKNQAREHVSERFEKSSYMFVHIREPEEIDRLKESLAKEGIVVNTLLITSPRCEDQVYGNKSDDDVSDYDYDCVYRNDKDLMTSRKEFWEFMYHNFPIF